MTYRIVITYQDNDHHDVAELASIVGYCVERKDLPKLVEHMLATEPAQSVHKGGTFAQTTVTLRHDGGVRKLQLKSAAQNVVPLISGPVSPHDSVVDIARRSTGGYVAPLRHMIHSPFLRQHGDLLQFVNLMPVDVQGTYFVKSQLHQLWWEWYDKKTTLVAVRKFLDEASIRVRTWYAEWLMGKLERLDFKGKEERMYIQSKLAAYKRGALTQPQFDKALFRSLGVLKKLSQRP